MPIWLRDSNVHYILQSHDRGKQPKCQPSSRSRNWGCDAFCVYLINFAPFYYNYNSSSKYNICALITQPDGLCSCAFGDYVTLSSTDRDLTRAYYSTTATYIRIIPLRTAPVHRRELRICCRYSTRHSNVQPTLARAHDPSIPLGL